MPSGYNSFLPHREKLEIAAVGLVHEQAGVFLGDTIHDVAQMVGAGYGMSKVTGDVATIVKLLRVAMLLPVILIITRVVPQASCCRHIRHFAATRNALVRGRICVACRRQQRWPDHL
jgi:integral membrane protein